MNLEKEHPTDGRKTRWSQHRESRRKELISAARNAVHDLGPEASMDEIAAHAGTSKSAFYRYFGDKTGLHTAVGQSSIDFMETALRQATENTVHPTDRLHSMILVYLKLADSSPNIYAFSTSSPGRLSDFFTRITEMMTPYFAGFINRNTGQAPAQQYLAQYWSTAAIGFVRHAGEQWLADQNSPQRPSLETVALQLTEWLIEGLNGPTPRTPTAHTILT